MLFKEAKSRLSLFQNRSYLYFTLSGLFATLGNGLNYIAISWLAYELTQSITGVALMMFFIWMPSIVFAPIFGVLADKYDKKRLMILSNIVRGVSIIIFVLFLGDNNTITHLLFLCGFLGVFVSFYMPAAIPYIYNIIDEEELVNANATVDMVYEFGTILGMGISGLIIHSFGMYGALMLGGVLFLVAGIFNMLMRKVASKYESKIENNSLLKDYLESLRYFKRTPVLYVPYFSQAIIMVLLMTIPVLLVPYAKEVLHTDTNTFALYEALYSFGVVVGGFFSPILCRIFSMKRTLIMLLLIMAVGLSFLSFNSNVVFVFPIYFFLGFGLSSWALSITLAQQSCLPEYQGRLQSTFNGVSGVFILILYIFMAFKSDDLSIQFVYLLQAILAIIGAIFIAFFYRKI